MYKKSKIYNLRSEMSGGVERYFVSFKDGEGSHHEIEIDFEVYIAFLSFEKQDEHESYVCRKYMEHKEKSEEEINRHAATPAKILEEIVCEKEFSSAFWIAVGELTEIQRRRFLLYYDFDYTYEQIAKMEGCRRQPVERSILKAKEKISKILKNI